MSQAPLSERPYTNSNLFSAHYLDDRIQQRDEWDCDDDAREALTALQTLYTEERELVESYGEESLIDNWIDNVLEILGFETNVETTLPDGSGFVDTLLFEDTVARRDATKGHLDTERTADLFDSGIGILEAKRWDTDFNKRLSERRPYRNASHQIKHYLERTPETIQWGILTNGRKWRLYGTRDYETRTYYEIDLPELLERGDLEAFKYFYVFFCPEAFRDRAGPTFLDSVWSESETVAQELGEDLQDNVFTALRVLGRGFAETNDLDVDPDDDEELAKLKEQSLVLLYRLMFVLYAESRGLVHSERKDAVEEYEENFSLDELRLEIHDEIGEVDEGFDDAYSKRSTTMWSRLEDLFRLIDEGEKALGMPPYNGGLFNREKHEFLTDYKVSNRYLAAVIYRISTIENDERRYVLVDYADLDTRHLGSVYEGLLEHQFRIAPDEYAAVSEDGGQVWKPATEVSVAEAVETVDEGGLYVVNDEGERKATGAYYTPDYVVTYIVEEAVGPLLEEIKDDLSEQGFEPGTHEYLRAFYRRVTDLQILDPAMGSGHFLTRATEYLAQRVMEEVRELEEATAFDEQRVRRDVAKECIYGVDLNGMAVELAKLSMWLETLAADQPLAFLDHHLKTGNSLVGSDVTEVLSSNAEDNDGKPPLQQTLARVRQSTLEHVMERTQELLEVDNESLEDVKSMEALYEGIRSDPFYQRLFELTNAHTAERFGLEVPGEAYDRMAHAIDDEEEWARLRTEDWFRTAQEMCNEEAFFHWELEYPEVFFGDEGETRPNAGFDAVIGNPPYIRIQELRGVDSSQADYLLKEYTSASKNFDIYVTFTEKGHDLLKKEGLLAYIEPHKFFQSNFGEGVRNCIAREKALKKVVSFGHQQVFEGVSVYTCVLLLKNDRNETFEYAEIDPKRLPRGEAIDFHTSEATYTEEPWIFQSPETLQVLESIERSGPSLAEITSKIYQGLVTSADDVYLVTIKKSLGDTVVVENGDDTEFEVESQLVQPFLKGQDVKRYSPLEPPQRILFPYRISDDNPPEFISESTLSRDYPKTHSYFKSYEDELRKRDGGSMDGPRWYDLTRNQNMTEFSRSKILTPEISYGSNFAYDSDGIFHKSKVYGILFTDEWRGTENAMLGVLNSSLLWYYLQNTGYVLQGGYVTFKTEYLKPFSVPERETFDSSTGDTTYTERLSNLVKEAEDARSGFRSLDLAVLDHFGSYSDGHLLSEIGLAQPPEGSADSILTDTAEDRESLRVGAVEVVRESPTSLEIHLTARYKPEDEDEHETDRWGYTETEPLPALRISDLDEIEADLIEAFVPVAVDEAGGFANFRETATKTSSPVDRLRKLTLPAVDDVRDGLDSYLETKQRAEGLETKIEQTDELIDETVYELYGLTDGEIDIVDEAVSD